MTLLTDEQLANIAHDYFLSNLNIADISKKYNISRYLIARAIAEAQEKGIVKISIYQSPKRAQKLEQKFQRYFNLQEAYILEDLETKNQEDEMVVNYAAKQIQNYIRSAHVVGLAWGALLRDIIDNFSAVNQEDLTFIQLVGQVFNTTKRKMPLAQDAAKIFHARSLIFPAPLYTLNPGLVTGLKQEPYYQAVEQFFPKLDLIFTSIGTSESLAANKFLMDNYTPVLFPQAAFKQIAGVILGRPYDIKGHFLPTVDAHLCGISLDELMHVPKRFVIVKSRFKEDALLGALRSGITTHLITTSGIAKRVLQKAQLS